MSIYVTKKEEKKLWPWNILFKKKKCFIRLNKIFNLSKTFKKSKGN